MDIIISIMIFISGGIIAAMALEERAKKNQDLPTTKLARSIWLAGLRMEIILMTAVLIWVLLS